MKEERIVRYKKGMKDETDWARVRAMSDDAIDFSDNPELDEQFWATAKLVMPKTRASLDVSLDRDVVNWFKKQGSGYPKKMSAILKTYIQAKESFAKNKQKQRKAAN